jgi:hypothetical protein
VLQCQLGLQRVPQGGRDPQHAELQGRQSSEKRLGGATLGLQAPQLCGSGSHVPSKPGTAGAGCT